MAAGTIAAAAALVAVAACSSAYGELETRDDATVDAGSDVDARMPVTDDVPRDASDAHDEDPLLSPSGCSDGTREGYADASRIAACAGGWSQPGLIAPVPVTCARQAGNSGMNPGGNGCSGGDLCAIGWHVCVDHADVASSHPKADPPGPCELAPSATGILLYGTAQPSTGAASCDAVLPDGGGTNDVFGCGDLSDQPEDASCAPLNATLSSDHLIGGWLVNGPQNERETVEHLGAMGGVLCCAD